MTFLCFPICFPIRFDDNMYEAYDPRDAIRQKIGTEKYDPNTESTSYTINTTDDRGNDIYIPMILSEDINDQTFPEMPFIEMLNMQTTYDEHNPGATIREMRAIIQLNFYFTRTDEITPSTFIKAIRDELQNASRTNQEDVPGTWYMNIDRERPQINSDGSSVTYLVIFEIEAIFTDRC